MALVDLDDLPAEVGSLGYWLDALDFVIAGEDHEEDILDVSAHGFPRDWPDVYEESDSLRGLLRSRGPCAAKRVSVVPEPEPVDVEVKFLQSYANAESCGKARGLRTVEGWAIYDLLEDVTGAAFLAERYWWNEAPDGTWLDYSPRPENCQQLLLAESLFPQGPKTASPLTADQEAIGQRLLALRFPRAQRAGTKVLRWRARWPEPAAASAQGSEPSEHSSAEQADEAQQDLANAAPERTDVEVKSELEKVMVAQAPLTAEAARGLLRALPTTLAEARQHLEQHESCDRLITTGLSGALVPHLENLEALALLEDLGRRSMQMPMPGGTLHRRMAEALMTAEGLPGLVRVLSKDAARSSLAARAMSHICYRNPPAQLKSARAGAIRALVRLLGRRESLTDATCALWNILVGQKEHAAMAFREGAAATLLPILSSVDHELLMNALGCLTSLLMAEGASEALGANGAVEAVCRFLDDEWPLALREQATSALANLLSGHRENARKAAYSCAALQRLLRLLRAGGRSRLAEAACAALANLVVMGPMMAQDALDAGLLDLVPTLLDLTTKPVQLFGLLANLCWQLPQICLEVYQLTPIARLVDVLKPGEDQAPSACLAAMALAANLASVSQAKAKLLRAGVLKPTATIIESSVDRSLREHASIALANLLENSPESVAKAFLELPDLPRRLAFLLNNKKTPLPMKVHENVTRALALLASREAARVSVKESGAPEALWSSLEDAHLAKGAAMGLLNLALVAKDRDKLLKKGLIPRLVRLLPQPGGTYAAGALANLTAGSRWAAREAAEAGAARPLVALLQQQVGDLEVTGRRLELCGGEEDAACWAMGALAHIAELTGAELKEAEVALGAACQVLRLSSGSVCELVVYFMAALVTQENKAVLQREEFKLKDLSLELEGSFKDKAQRLYLMSRS